MISFSTLEPDVWYRLVYWTAVGQLGKAAAGIMRRKAEPHEAAVICQDQEVRLRGEGLAQYCKTYCNCRTASAGSRVMGTLFSQVVQPNIIGSLGSTS